jgi:hypothetical protein
MARLAAFAAAAACALAALPVANAGTDGDSPRAFSGQYEGRKKIAFVTATARADIELRRSSRFILYTMNTTVTWALFERRFRDCSVMRIDGERLLALEYVHIDESDAGLDVRTRFDWNDNRASTVLGSSAEASSTGIVWPTWDPMSFQVALMSLAPRRAPGEQQVHRVIERGVMKEHQVAFAGAVGTAALPQGVQAHEIVSRKSNGKMVTMLLVPQSWQPYRITIDDVTIERIGGWGSTTPPAIPEEQVPRCPAERAPR